MHSSFLFEPAGFEADIKQLFDEVYAHQSHLPLSDGEIRPKDIVPVLINTDGGIKAAPMIWGFPKWDSKGVVPQAMG